jgi:hypothetical protein
MANISGGEHLGVGLSRFGAEPGNYRWVVDRRGRKSTFRYRKHGCRRNFWNDRILTDG